ncbi:MAG TPA: efflux RND transporter periplasmic adaptor subunit, partial [Burkholderiaceae bacterium]|nr:efflux RND transporter periplasmic adaptor subunit [Burkholderiaceae bacterium]
MTRRTLAVVVALALLLAGALAFWRLRAPTAAAMRLEAAPLLRTLQFSARVAALSRVDVGSTITGRVIEVRVREGDPVRA